jgi:hypothetical protein
MKLKDVELKDVVLVLVLIGVISCFVFLIYNDVQKESSYQERLVLCEDWNDGCVVWKCKSILAEQEDRLNDAISFEVKRTSCLVSLLEVRK